MPEGISGLVWVGDMLPTSVCPASNAGELMRLERSWVEHFARVLASTLVHEAQHINSVYKRLLNTLEDPFAYDTQHDGWIEEGRAVLAEEEASRLAWADLGGPAPYQQATAAEAPVVWTEAVDAPTTTPAAGRFHLAKRQTGGQMALALGRVAIRGRHVRSVSVRRGD